MDIKQRVLLILCKTIYKPVRLEKSDVIKTVFVNHSNVQYIKETTFNVLKVKVNGEYKYFRECREHGRFKAYLHQIIDDFFANYNKYSEFNKYKNKIYEKLTSKGNIDKVYNLGIINDKNSLVTKIFKEKNISLIGLEDFQVLPIIYFLDFLQFLWGEIYSYRLNEGVPEGSLQSFCASRILATKTLADLLNLGRIIPNVELVELHVGDKDVRYGTLMDEVMGVSPSLLTDEEKLMLSPNFQRDCSDLNLLDALTNEKDHRPGNYLVSFDDRLIQGLQAFDNDSPMSFFITPKINLSTYWGSTPFVDSRGIISIPYLSKDTALGILNLNENTINASFKSTLTRIQIFFLKLRIRRMQKAINKTLKNNKRFLLEDDEWNDYTLNEELNMQNLNTYLRIFCFSKMKEHNYEEL
ncbi:hypothetical protein [Phascolarctobacterium succinatutens]|uniref:hypothetical protein n=1 Tax=Phascolarctobacterium succinatutens TaxID=626940 RepID=UPI00307880A4